MDRYRLEVDRVAREIVNQVTQEGSNLPVDKSASSTPVRLTPSVMDLPALRSEWSGREASRLASTVSQASTNGPDPDVKDEEQDLGSQGVLRFASVSTSRRERHIEGHHGLPTLPGKDWLVNYFATLTWGAAGGDYPILHHGKGRSAVNVVDVKGNRGHLGLSAGIRADVSGMEGESVGRQKEASSRSAAGYTPVDMTAMLTWKERKDGCEGPEGGDHQRPHAGLRRQGGRGPSRAWSPAGYSSGPGSGEGGRHSMTTGNRTAFGGTASSEPDARAGIAGRSCQHAQTPGEIFMQNDG